MEAAALCKDEKCDFIVGLGGGSSIDSAKAIAVMACNPGDYWDYIPAGTGERTACQQSAACCSHSHNRRNRNGS